MRKLMNKCSTVFLTSLCALMLITMSVILTPEVEAASDTPITETKNSVTSTNTSKEDDALALARAIAIDEAKKEAESAVEELKVEVAQETQPTVEETQPSVEETQADTVETSSSGSSTSSSSQSSSYVAGSTSTGYLMDIENPDPNYTSYSICLSDADRDLAERIVMGEAGSTGYTGMALVAQCLRDTFVKGGYSDIASVIAQNGYYGSTSIKPSQTCKDVINYIFDQGGAAVQHRMIVYYASNYCSSSWHESQNFVCSYGYVRFFDTWY